MTKNDIDYTLLEIIEGPKRINNISHDRLFRYLLESTESQDRFESFMRTLELNAWWAYLGISLMCSDMIPFKNLFREEFSEITEIKYKRSSLNEHSVLNMILSYFEKGILTEKKHRLYLIRYMGETLSSDEYSFCCTCIQQKYKDEIYPYLKKMYENNKLNLKVCEMFSFAMDNSFNERGVFTNVCLPVGRFKKYVKVGKMLFENGEVTNYRTSKQIMSYIDTCRKMNNQVTDYSFVYEVYVEDENNTPFMIVTKDKSFIIKKPIFCDDLKLIELFYSGFKNFVSTDKSGTVVSLLSEQNGFLSLDNIKCKTVKRLNVPLPMLGRNIEFLLCKTDDGKEITVFLPTSLSKEVFKNGDIIDIIGFNSTYYLRGKRENDVQ